VTRYISEDLKRLLDDDPPLCVAAAYELNLLVNKGGRVLFEGRPVGIFDDESAAKQWLATGEPQPQGITVA